MPIHKYDGKNTKTKSKRKTPQDCLHKFLNKRKEEDNHVNIPSYVEI